MMTNNFSRALWKLTRSLHIILALHKVNSFLPLSKMSLKMYKLKKQLTIYNSKSSFNQNHASRSSKKSLKHKITKKTYHKPTKKLIILISNNQNIQTKIKLTIRSMWIWNVMTIPTKTQLCNKMILNKNNQSHNNYQNQSNLVNSKICKLELSKLMISMKVKIMRHHRFSSLRKKSQSDRNQYMRISNNNSWNKVQNHNYKLASRIKLRRRNSS